MEEEKTKKSILLAITAIIIIICSFMGCNHGAHVKNDTSSTTSTIIDSTKESITTSTENVTETTEVVTDTTVETASVTDETVITKPTTEPESTEPQPTEPKPTEPKPTEPKPTEPKPTEPKPTEPKPTEPAPTEPKPTEPEPTEPEPTEPSVSYNTAWGTRPFEFQEIDHYEMWEGYICHYDRYGNTWWDRTNGYSSASGKYIYRGSISSYPCVRYYGNGRWTGNGYCWDQNGNMEGYYVYGGYTFYNSWGNDYTEYWLPSDMPNDYDNWLFNINAYANYPDYRALGIPSELSDGTIITDEMYENAINGGLELPYSPYIGR